MANIHTQTYRPKYIHRNLIVEYLKKAKEKKMLNHNEFIYLTSNKP